MCAGEQLTEDKQWIQEGSPYWNMFLQERADTQGGINLDDLYMDDLYMDDWHMDNRHVDNRHMDSYSLNEYNNASRAAVQLDLWRHFLLSALLSTVQNNDNVDSGARRAGNFANEVDEFMVGVRRYVKNIKGIELTADREGMYRQILSAWNTFLQPAQGIRGTSAFISVDFQKEFSEYISLGSLTGIQYTEEHKLDVKRWLSKWNKFLQARAGDKPVTRLNVSLTIVGFIFYILDLVTDIGTASYFAGNGQWWRAIVTLAFVYSPVIVHTGWKWADGQIQCTGADAWLRYVASLLVNRPDVKQYGALCRLEWQLHKSPVKNARLIPEWCKRRTNVARLKFLEGLCEACPQAILQLCLLVPDLYGDWTWTDYLRIASASISLSTAGAALVNRQKYDRLLDHIDLAVSELVVLHVWAVPVIVSRLLCVALALSVHPYWALAAVVLHVVLCAMYRCRTKGFARTKSDVIAISLNTVQIFMSPFDVVGSVTYRRVYHAIHFLVNTAAMVVWALSTPLVCVHPALYTAIICVNAVMVAVGLVGWQLHEKHWPDSYHGTFIRYWCPVTNTWINSRIQ